MKNDVIGRDHNGCGDQTAHDAGGDSAPGKPDKLLSQQCYGYGEGDSCQQITENAVKAASVDNKVERGFQKSALKSAAGPQKETA